MLLSMDWYEHRKVVWLATLESLGGAIQSDARAADLMCKRFVELIRTVVASVTMSNS